MTKIQLSGTMVETLAYTAEHGMPLGSGHGIGTWRALESRGMLAAVDGRWTVTAAGWTWLKDNAGIERSADAGRLTVEEALELAYPHNEQVDAVGAWITAVMIQDRDRREAGRLTVDEALAAGYPETWEGAQILGDTAVSGRVDARTLKVYGPADYAGRLTLEEALAEAYTNLGVNTAYSAEYLAELDGPGGQLVLQRNPGGSCGFSFLGAGGSIIQCLGAAEANRTTCDVHHWHGVDMPPLPVREPGATDLDAGRLTLDEALADAYRRSGSLRGWGYNRLTIGTHWLLRSGWRREGREWRPGTAEERSQDAGRLTLDEAWTAAERIADVQRQNAARMAVNPEPPRRDGWLDQEAGSGPGAGPATSANGWLSMGSLADEFRYAFPGAVEIEDSIVIPDIGALDVPLSRVVQEANRLTEARDTFARKAVYREHTPEDDMYVDRSAWKAEETRIAALREQLRTSTRQRNTFEARNGRAPLCGREMSTGRPCPQHTPEDTREQYTKRDTYGDPIAYRDVPVPADLAGHWYGVEAISWTRGVNASYVQAVRIAKGLGL